MMELGSRVHLGSRHTTPQPGRTQELRVDILPAPATAGMVAGEERRRAVCLLLGRSRGGRGGRDLPRPLNPEPQSSFPAVGTTHFETGPGERCSGFAPGIRCAPQGRKDRFLLPTHPQAGEPDHRQPERRQAMRPYLSTAVA